MHICPHCEKLGISSVAALGDGFSRGLASCRYCHNVSKAHRGVAFYVTMPIAMLIFYSAFFYLKPPVEFALLWLGIIGVIALMIIDRNVDFEKRERLDRPPVSIREETLP